MTRTMVPQASAWALRGVRPATPGSFTTEDHLHYDRGARVWRTHAELQARDAVSALAALSDDERLDEMAAQLQECA